MKQTLKYIMLIFALLFVDNLYSQKMELLSLDYIEIGRGKVKGFTPISFSRYQVQVQLPTRLKKKGCFISNGFLYSSTNINYGDISNFSVKDLDHFQTLEYKFLYSAPLKNNKWRFTALFRPNLSTNSRLGENFEDIRFFGLAFYTKSINKKFSYSLGALYGTTIGIPAPLPFLMLHYTPNRNWRFDLGFPRIYITNTIGENTKIGANLIFQGENITLDDKLEYKDQSTPIDNIKQNNVALGLFVKQKIYKYLYFNANVAYTLSRTYQFRKNNDILRDFNISNNIYVKAGISIGI